jgi:hypothetical protein
VRSWEKGDSKSSHTSPLSRLLPPNGQGSATRRHFSAAGCGLASPHWVHSATSTKLRPAAKLRRPFPWMMQAPASGSDDRMLCETGKPRGDHGPPLRASPQSLRKSRISVRNNRAVMAFACPTNRRRDLNFKEGLRQGASQTIRVTSRITNARTRRHHTIDEQNCDTTIKVQ